MAELTRRALLAAPAGLLVAATVGPAPEPAYAHGDPYGRMLAEEHAVVYLYGVLAPRLPAALRPAARAAHDTHRRHRDLLISLIEQGRGVPSPAAPAYELPAPLTGPGGALGVAVAVESSIVRHWWDAVGEVAPAHRAELVRAYAEDAATLAGWLWAQRPTPASAAEPFPGRPG